MTHNKNQATDSVNIYVVVPDSVDIYVSVNSPVHLSNSLFFSPAFSTFPMLLRLRFHNLYVYVFVNSYVDAHAHAHAHII
jgi:hypothetical protein